MSTKSKTLTRSSRCQVCKHPERTRIELMRASGVSLDVIASKFNVGRDAVNRHWHGHVSDQMKAFFLAGPLQLRNSRKKRQRPAHRFSTIVRTPGTWPCSGYASAADHAGL